MGRRSTPGPQRLQYTRFIATQILKAPMHHAEIARSLQPVVKPEYAIRVYTARRTWDLKRQDQRALNPETQAKYAYRRVTHTLDQKIEMGLRYIANHAICNLRKNGYVTEVNGRWKLTSAGKSYAELARHLERIGSIALPK